MKALVFLCMLLTGCSVPFVGQVAHQLVYCEEPAKCKAAAVQACPEGGTIHRISPALAVEFSCK